MDSSQDRHQSLMDAKSSLNEIRAHVAQSNLSGAGAIDHHLASAGFHLDHIVRAHAAGDGDTYHDAHMAAGKHLSAAMQSLSSMGAQNPVADHHSGKVDQLILKLNQSY